MKLLLWSTGALILSATFINAQSEDAVPRGEVGFTYSLVHRNNEQMTNSYNQNGGSGYFALNVTKSLAIVADLGGYVGGPGAGLGPDRQTFAYLFGPRLNFRRSRITPYVQFLF